MFQNFQIEGSLPNVNELTFTKIHKNYLKVIVLNFLVVVVAIFVATYFLIYKSENSFLSSYSVYIYLAIPIVLLIVLLLLIIGFTKRKYALREKDISYKSGVLVQSLTTVPFSRIQHIEIDEQLFSRFFKLASLSIYTAGEGGDDLTIKGLPKDEALKIKEFITSFING